MTEREQELCFTDIKVRLNQLEKTRYQMIMARQDRPDHPSYNEFLLIQEKITATRKLARLLNTVSRVRKLN